MAVDIKEKIEKIVKKLLNDKDLMEKFNRNPVSVIEEYAGVDLPDDLVNQLIEGIKAKISLEKVGGAIDALGSLFKK